MAETPETSTRLMRAFLESGADYAAEFEFGLDLILDGIERVSDR